MTTTAELQTAPQLVTRLPGPKAAALIARDDQVLSPSYTRQYPLVAERGWGCVIEDVDGNRFLDFTAGIAVTATGHCDPEVVAAIADQAGKLIHMSGTDFFYRPEIELAERLARLAPGAEPKRVFFANSGTESIEAAIKLARYHTGRSRLIAFYGAFHGRSCGALSLSASKAIHRRGFGPLLAGVHHATYDCDERELERVLAHVAPAEEVAAVFVEPIQGESGYRVPSADFLPMLRRVCDRHGILLVADEVQSGIGRTGRMFACEHFGVVPDVICLAKGLASGMPLGAVVAKAELMDWPPGAHASTFGGNPISCRAALATLDLIDRGLLDQARQRGDELCQGLARLAAQGLPITAVRGLGLMLACDVVTDGQPDSRRRDDVLQEAFERGLLLLGCGPAGIRFCPALCVTSAQCETALQVLASALQATGASR
ncbi:MAG: acetyl ornithine aminotransferase family protein [Pirellulales bacterium]|nr:acetyl ornithine aminotransferase family protein [Pirellulales bacterium]